MSITTSPAPPRRPVIYSETRTVQEWIDMLAAMNPLEMREFRYQLWNEIKEHAPNDRVRLRIDPFL